MMPELMVGPPQVSPQKPSQSSGSRISPPELELDWFMHPMGHCSAVRVEAISSAAA